MNYILYNICAQISLHALDCIYMPGSLMQQNKHAQT